MRVGFYHAATHETPHVEYAKRLIASVRRAMPGVEVWQFTDLVTPGIEGVDCVDRERRSPRIAYERIGSYARQGDWLFVDTDILVQRDVRDVFDTSFDVAVATREGTLKPSEVGKKFIGSMPYNLGAVFSRGPEFWWRAVQVMRSYSEKRQGWMGDQQALNDTIRDAEHHWRVLVLPNSYNYPPFARDEDVRGKHVLHFKGKRKAWMLERAA